MIKDRSFVLTGAFGSGKSTLLAALQERGIPIVVEPARPILAQQRSIGGTGVPEKDARLFVELMLSRLLDTYQQSEDLSGPVVFDRGIPDILGYADLFGFAFEPGENAAQLYRYHPQVFFAPAWEDIYRTDEERKASFSIARAFGETLRDIYQRLGYTLIELPLASVDERADFVCQHLSLR